MHPYRVVKKYHYLVGVKKDISITDESLVTLAMDDILDDIFDRAYARGDEKFENFLKKYTIKNDSPIRKAILELIKKIDSYIDKNRMS